ncbi:unnamed protein product [Heterobilharzia americana]|nr:unnamed protein product [Heterobilharzia americana]CAH8437436.1 unnamed protein product [Heterobilharzia americana]
MVSLTAVDLSPPVSLTSLSNCLLLPIAAAFSVSLAFAAHYCLRLRSASIKKVPPKCLSASLSLLTCALKSPATTTSKRLAFERRLDSLRWNSSFTSPELQSVGA